MDRKDFLLNVYTMIVTAPSGGPMATPLNLVLLRIYCQLCSLFVQNLVMLVCVFLLCTIYVESDAPCRVPTWARLAENNAALI